jgi:hypothetical protein
MKTMPCTLDFPASRGPHWVEHKGRKTNAQNARMRTSRPWMQLSAHPCAPWDLARYVRRLRSRGSGKRTTQPDVRYRSLTPVAAAPTAGPAMIKQDMQPCFREHVADLEKTFDLQTSLGFPSAFCSNHLPANHRKARKRTSTISKESPQGVASCNGSIEDEQA